MMLSFAMATPSMIHMDVLPMFVCGGPGKFSEEDKQEAVGDYLNHLRAFVLQSLDTPPAPRLTASVNLLTQAMKGEGERSEGGAK